MTLSHRAQLEQIRTFPQLIRFLRDEMGWPIETEDFEDLTFTYTLEELGIDPGSAAGSAEIQRLRPLVADQPWGIFFVRFEPKRLPVVALRRILSAFVMRKRASANSADRMTWETDDLLFISSYGEDEDRQLSFAHFSPRADGSSLPTLKVLGWDNRDTALHLDAVAETLTQKLVWPADGTDVADWRESWRSAFTLRYRETVTTSRELSIRLAELARAIRDRIRAALAIETPNGPLRTLLNAFKKALVHDLDSDSFADMYAQTIAYGLLSARIADPTSQNADDLATHLRTSPFLKGLMETFLRVSGQSGREDDQGINFDELGVGEVADLLDDPAKTNMGAVIRDFGDRNPEEDPVIHFYESFLREYDPDEKVKRGVFYTPRPVVSYIVRSVDELLCTEFGLEDGLADTSTWSQVAKSNGHFDLPEGVDPDQAFVQILDPATGTGTFLVEVIDVIHRRMTRKWAVLGHGEASIADLWNEYVPEHLLPRIHGFELLMAPYAIAHLKVGLKLFETGYHFGSDERARIYLTNSLEPGHDFSGTMDFAVPALAEEAKAASEIKRKSHFTVVVGNPPYAKSSSNRSVAAEDLVAEYKRLVYGETNVQPLSDDYVKFIAYSFGITVPGASVIGMITNRSYLDGLIHRGMRAMLLQACSSVFIADLHGDSNVGEYPPQGQANENVFDIMQGVAVSIFVRLPRGQNDAVQRCDMWGTRLQKYTALDHARAPEGYSSLGCSEPYWFFSPKDLSCQAEQVSWVAVNDLFQVAGMGVKSRRDHFLIDQSRQALLARFERLAGALDVEALRPELRVTDNPQWSLAGMRDLVLREGVENCIVAIAYRPFDTRFIWYHREAIERGDARWPVMKQVLPSGLSLLTSRQSVNHDFSSVFVARGLSEMKAAESTRGSYAFPLRQAQNSGLLDGLMGAPNLHAEMLGPTLSNREPEELLGYVYGVLHSAAYRERYASALRIEFPKIPPDCSVGLADAVCRLGNDLVSLHLLESSALDDLASTYEGPPRPLVGRVRWSYDSVWLDAAATRRGQPTSPGTIGFHGVPNAVWGFQVGGYQVCEKWLKDRKGRTLSGDDIAYYQKIIVAIAETIRIMGEIDEVIAEHGGWPGAFHWAASNGAA